MSVRVLVERHVRAGFEGWVWHMLKQVRTEQLQARGYLYGESWCRVDSPRLFMTFSVWGSLGQWQAWSQSELQKPD